MLISWLKHDKEVISRGTILINLSDSTITCYCFWISEGVRMADSDPRSLKPQKAGIRMIVFPWVLMAINVFALETEAISYLYLRERDQCSAAQSAPGVCLMWN